MIRLVAGLQSSVTDVARSMTYVNNELKYIGSNVIDIRIVISHIGDDISEDVRIVQRM